MLKKMCLLYGLGFSLLFGASKCPDLQDLQQHNGHFYGITSNTMTFDEAKKFAESKGGYLAIPNTAAENTFLKSILGGRKGGWLGVYDPSYSSSYSYSVGQKKNSSRFRDIKGNALSYAYWESSQPDNLVEEYDTYNGQQRVSPLGEHWVAMDGNSGKWWDYGNHFDYGNARFYALLEFNSAPTCFEDLSSNIVDTFTNKKCSTQIWDSSAGNLEAGAIFDCRTDSYGNTYCPSSLAQCAQQWDYDSGFSVAGLGQVVDYINKEEDASSPAILMQKGVKAERAANGLYYTVVISSETTYGAKTTCSSLGSGWRLPQGNETGSGGVPVGGQEYVIPNYSNYCSGIGDFATLGDCAKYSLSPAVTNDWTSPRRNYRCVNTSPVNIVNGYVVISGYTVTKAGNGLYYTNVFPGKVPTGARDFYGALGGEWRLPQGCETGSGKVPVGGQEYVYTDRCACNNGYTLSTKSDCKGYQFGWGDVRAFRCVASNPSNVIHNTKCPSGYTETTGAETSKGECKRTVEYTYYNYLCNNSKNEQGYNYLPINTGGNCNKTDPNNSTSNPELSNPCNSPTPPANNCKREKFTCQANSDRPCSFVDNKWQCSPFPCMGGNDVTPEGTIEGTSDKNNNGWSEDGMCNGQIYIFNGKDRRCRSWDMFFGLVGGGCCDKDKVFMGLVGCKENEKMLAKQNKAELCTELGEYCSKKIKLGFAKICVQKSKGHCCFGSKLARFVHEQGRSQLGISWGTAENPQCRGFTPEEFQKLDFSKIDLTGAFDIPEINQTDLTNKINSTVTNFKNMLGN